jgi:hypothetical protein
MHYSVEYDHYSAMYEVVVWIETTSDTKAGTVVAKRDTEEEAQRVCDQLNRTSL